MHADEIRQGLFRYGRTPGCLAPVAQRLGAGFCRACGSRRAARRRPRSWPAAGGADRDRVQPPRASQSAAGGRAADGRSLARLGIAADRGRTIRRARAVRGAQG